MKRSVCVLLSLCLMLTLFAGMTVSASANADFLYTVGADGATLTGYVGTATEVTVPDTLGGQKVVAVGTNAFENNAALVSVTLPDSVTFLDEAAFMNCSALAYIHVGSVKTVAYSAFYGCTALTAVSYAGSESGWKAVSVAAYNEPLLAAEVTCAGGSGFLDLMPAYRSGFSTLSEGGGTISITSLTEGYAFQGSGGWPSAYTTRTADEYVTVDVFSDTYLNFDISVYGGATNIILAFNGMDIVNLRTEGHYVTLNRLIDPAYVDENGTIYDVWDGTYTASVHVGALGCDPSLVTNGTFSISDIKIYAVDGATLLVRDLSVGEAKYDILDVPQTSYTIQTSQSLLPSKASEFAKGHTDTGNLNAVKTSEGFLFTSTNGWPCAYTKRYQTGDGYILADPDDYLYFDFTVEGTAQTHLAVYFAGTDPMDTVTGTYASLNPLIHPNYRDANGAVIDLYGGNFKGYIKVRDLGCDPLLMQNGKVPISDIKIFSVNNYQDVNACIVLRELAVVEIETYETETTTTTTTTATTATTTTVTAPAVTYSVSVGQQTVDVGDTVDVALCVSEGHYLVNGQIWIDYDPSVLEPLDPFEVGCVTEVNTAIFDSSYMWDANVPTPGRFKFAFASSKPEGTTAGGTMFTLTFKVLSMPQGGTTAVTLCAPETGAAVNGVDVDITPAFENAAITVTAMRGDVDSNGIVNIYDALRLFKHVNEEITLEGAELAAGELNDDGEPNIYDALRLFKFVNEEIDSL